MSCSHALLVGIENPCGLLIRSPVLGQVDFAPVANHYGISPMAARLRMSRLEVLMNQLDAERASTGAATNANDATDSAIDAATNDVADKVDDEAV